MSWALQCQWPCSRQMAAESGGKGHSKQHNHVSKADSSTGHDMFTMNCEWLDVWL